MLIERGLELKLHAPNGMQPRFIDKEMAQLFYLAKMRTIRLSFESSNAARQRAMSSKVTNKELQQALNHLSRAGYDRNEIVVYVMLGLPDQEINEVEESIGYVQSLGARVSIASFSPIPGTVDWYKALSLGYWYEENDLLLTNCSVFPIWSQKFGYQQTRDFYAQFKQLLDKE